MCELMALSFARPVSADFSIRAFALRGSENADGWGLAWYPDRSLALVKEPLQWGASAYTGFLESYPNLLSPLYIAHVRHGTTGGKPTHADTHPFARELGGRPYCFAHNGTLEGFERLPLGRFHPVGSTDSEHTFCHLLDRVARRPFRPSSG
jgi:glutamine amidotransferase